MRIFFGPREKTLKKSTQTSRQRNPSANAKYRLR